MSVKIGHARINEDGKARGGSRGDQTGREVVVSNWYNGNWDYVLRPKNAALAEKSADACEAACNNDAIGYDQNTRNTLIEQARKVGFDMGKISVRCSCDCSSFMHVCAIAGGANLSYGSNGLVCSTMRRAFEKTGQYEILTGSQYTKSDELLRRGDILVDADKHTVMVLGNGGGFAGSGGIDLVEDENKATGDNTLVMLAAIIMICVALFFGVGLAVMGGN